MLDLELGMRADMDRLRWYYMVVVIVIIANNALLHLGVRLCKMVLSFTCLINYA